MKTRFRAAFLVGVALCVAASSHTALAAPNTLVPTKDEIVLPKFGFTGSTIEGVGDRIVTLTPGGRFEKLGVEIGDVILSVNGFTLTYDGSWRDSLLKARSQGATNLRLRIRDVRTGVVRNRDISVSFSGSGGGGSNPHPAQLAKLASLKNELKTLQLQALQLQSVPEPFRTKALQQNTARRQAVIREISQLQQILKT